jgi:hypothetical protein
MATRGYFFHGVNVFVAGGPEAQAAVEARLGLFPAAKNKAPSELHFEFIRTKGNPPPAKPTGRGRAILEVECGEVLYFDESDELYLEFPGRGQSRCDMKSRVVTVWYPDSVAGDARLLGHSYFTIALAELLKREGLFMVHAAGLALDGKGLLVAGQSGSGKTTLTLAMVRAGFGFMGDDTLFLAAAPGGMRVLAFPDEADITEQTAGFFPELQAWPGALRPDGRRKKALGVAQTYGIRPCWECAPSALVFPQPAGSGESVLTAMPPSEALVQLVCNVLRTEPLSSQAHLDALAALVKSSRCYRLQTGRDFDSLSQLLRTLIE